MSESKAQRAYRFIRERIDDGRYVPGFRLVLGTIARELDVSVVPVREAIRLLEAEGLVTFERNVGAQVALIHEAEYLHTMQTLALVEGAATALATPAITPERVARARAINERMRQGLEAFDPHRHEAVETEPVPEVPHQQIIGEVQRGYLLDDRVLRPALVRVCMHPEADFAVDSEEGPE